MCAAYIAAGLPPERFWQITPRLFAIEMQGAAQRLERDRKDRVEAAWLTAALTRAKKLPPLERLLPPRKVKRQSREELQAMFDLMVARMGAKRA